MSEPGAEPQPGPEPGPEAEPAPGARVAGGGTGLVGAVLCLVAAVLTLFGAFQDLVLVENRGVGFQRMTVVIAVWDVRVENNGMPQPGPQNLVPVNGVPLLLATALLLVAALLGLPVLRRFHRVAGLVGVAAAAFLTAMVVVVGMQAMWWLSIFQPPVIGGPEDATTVFESSFGAGFWTLVAAAVLAIAATVPVWRGPRPEAWRVEPDTPRLGTPIVVRLPDEPQDKPPV